MPEQPWPRLPDFAALGAADYERLIGEAMTARTEALGALAAETAPPSVENVIVAWERAGLALGRVLDAFLTVRDAGVDEALEALDERLAPRLAAHEDAIILSRPFFDRLLALQEAAEAGRVDLDAEGAHWLSEQIREYRRHGVELPAEAQDELRELNARIAAASARFARLVVAEREQAAVPVTDESELAGLDPARRRAAADAAARRGSDGWLLELVNTTGQDALTGLDRQDVRRRVLEASLGRGGDGPEGTGPVIVELARLRARRAGLLGFDSHAAYVADEGCAGTVEAVWALLDRFGAQAVAAADAEAQEHRRAFARLAPGLDLGPWDWAWTAARSRAATAVDDETLSPTWSSAGFCARVSSPRPTSSTASR